MLNTHIKENVKPYILVDYSKELRLFFHVKLPITLQMTGYLTDDCASEYPV